MKDRCDGLLAAERDVVLGRVVFAVDVDRLLLC